jgi:arginase family enzyme
VPEPDASHVATAQMALDASMDVAKVVSDWVAEGRPGSADGLRARLEAAAESKPVESAVKELRAAGASSVAK